MERIGQIKDKKLTEECSENFGMLNFFMMEEND